MHCVLVALGTNEAFASVSGAALLSQALDAMTRRGLRITAVSSAWETRAEPFGDQPNFVNAVVSLETETEPQILYATLREVELEFGRVRDVRWAQRTLDLDIVDFAGRVGRYGDIELPHPRAAERAFVLAPLAEIAPGWRHPVSRETVGALLAVLPPPLARLGPLRP